MVLLALTNTVILSATTAALCEFEATLFTVVESKEQRSDLCEAGKYRLLDVMSKIRNEIIVRAL